MYVYTYHEYAEKFLSDKAANKHAQPNLVVAFNTGMREDSVENWKTSLETLLDMNVPCYFTSYNHGEAVRGWDVLTSVSAHILQDSPKRNPFSEDFMTVDPPTEGTIDCFFACSMYGVLFQGRK